MRHLFIVNPAAGKRGSTARLDALLEKLSFPHEAAYTEREGDALRFTQEAARSGEAGKGFAVVANEVKQLAAKSAEAAQRATKMVDNTKAIIQNGVVLTADTADSLRAISDVSAQISTISDQLAAAVQGQELALSAMEERIATISSIADRNLQNAGETEQSSGSLAKEAEALQSHVQKFILKEKRGR